MAEYVLREVRPGDIETLVERMRQADRDEIMRPDGDITTPVVQSVERSVQVHSLEIEGELAAIGGVVPISLLLRAAIPWALTTDVVDRYPRAYIRASREYTKAMQNDYEMLANWVDVRYVKAHKWLRRLGFTVDTETVVYMHGVQFHPLRYKKG